MYGKTEDKMVWPSTVRYEKREKNLQEIDEERLWEDVRE
jgi:hypothetical protein